MQLGSFDPYKGILAIELNNLPLDPIIKWHSTLRAHFDLPSDYRGTSLNNQYVMMSLFCGFLLYDSLYGLADVVSWKLYDFSLVQFL